MNVLHQVTPGEQGDQVPILIHNWQFTLLRTPEDFVGFGESGACRCGDEVCGHDSRDWILVVLVELDISTGDDSEKLRVEGSLLYERNKVRITKRSKKKKRATKEKSN
jgi:hypothetical protein